MPLSLLAILIAALAGPADEAAELLFVELPADAAGITSIFGMPSPAQRRRAERAAAEISRLAAEAEAALDASIRRGEATARDPRIGFLAGVGACLEAELMPPGDQRRRRFDVAAARLRAMIETLDGRPRALAKLYAGLAAAGAGDLDEAAALLVAAAEDPGAAPADALAARLGLARLEGRLDGVRAAAARLDDLFARSSSFASRVLIADARCRLMLAGSRGADEAIAGYLALLKADPARPQRRVIVDRLRRAAAAGVELDAAGPPPVRLARAAHLLETPATRPEALAALRELAMLPGPDGAAALLVLGRALLADGRPADAASAFARLAREHAREPEAEQAIELAATIAAELRRSRPGDEAARRLLREIVELLLERFPNLETADRWRYVAGSVALEGGRHADALEHFEAVTPVAPQWPAAVRGRIETLRAWGRWAQLLEAIPDARSVVDGPTLNRAEAEAQLALDRPRRALEALGDDVSAEAALLRLEASTALGDTQAAQRALDRVALDSDEAGGLLAALLEKRSGRVTVLLERGDEDAAAAAAQRELLPVAEVLAAWLARRGDDAPPALRLAAADAFRRARRHGAALDQYGRVLGAHPDLAAALFGRAECLYALGPAHDAEAMALYRRLGARAGGPHYWAAQLRMLQILSRAGRNTERIAPWIEWLRREDPEFGGERYRREFERLLMTERQRVTP